MSRESILAAIKANQPEPVAIPDLAGLGLGMEASADLYIKTLQGIGGKGYVVSAPGEIREILSATFPAARRVISTLPDIHKGTETSWMESNPHDLETVDLALIAGRFAVTENGAVWVTEEEAFIRVLPFICEHLAVVVPLRELVANMHQAYDKIGNSNYQFGVFIAGPSKTADIEQSLVLGAHGPKTMTVFLTCF